MFYISSIYIDIKCRKSKNWIIFKINYFYRENKKLIDIYM